MILTPPPPLTTSHTPANNLVQTIFSDNKSIMVAAIIFLVLVILFVLLLHAYARWFLFQARRRSARRSVALPQVIGATRVHEQIRSSFTTDTIFIDEFRTKGLDSSDISLIPLFVYKVDEHKKNGLECAICLSFFEEDEMGRKIPLCGHSFHVECIDMWLHSHATCPVCRADIVVRLDKNLDTSLNVVDPNHDISSEVEVNSSSNQDIVLEIVVDVPNLEDDNVSRRDSSSMCLLSCSSMSSSSQFDRDSLKKIVSRSRSERKVHPSMDLH